MNTPESWESKASGKKQRDRLRSGGFQTDMIHPDLLSIYDDPFLAAVASGRNKRHLLSLSLSDTQELRQTRPSIRSGVFRYKASRMGLQRMHRHRFAEPTLVQDHTIYIRLDGMTMQLIGNIQPPTQKLELRPTSLGTKKPKGVVFNFDRNSIFSASNAIKVYASRSKTKWSQLASLLHPSEDEEDEDEKRISVMGNAVNNYMSQSDANEAPNERKSLDEIAVDLYEAASASSSMQSVHAVENTVEFLGPDFDYKNKKTARPSLYQIIMKAMEENVLQKRSLDNLPVQVKASTSAVTPEGTASTCYTDAVEVDSVSVTTAPLSPHPWPETTRPVQVYRPTHRSVPLQNQFKKLVPVDLFVDQKIMSQTEYHEYVLESAHSASSRRRARSVTFSQQQELTDTDSLSSFGSFLDPDDTEWDWLPVGENNKDQNMNKSMGKRLTGADVIKERRPSKLLVLQYQLLKSKQEIAVLRAENRKLKDRRRQIQANEDTAVCNQPQSQSLPTALVLQIRCISCYTVAVFLGLVFGKFCC